MRPAMNKPPGKWHLAVTVAALMVAVAAWCRWWPRDDNAFLTGVASGLVLLGCGLWWAIRSIYVAGQDRRWSWWILPAPVAVGIAILVALWGAPSFEQARPKMDEIAAELRADPDASSVSWWNDSPLERFDIRFVHEDADGNVYFKFTIYGANKGWMHASAGPPEKDFLELIPLGDGWYRYELPWVNPSPGMVPPD